MFSPECRIGDLNPLMNEKHIQLAEDMTLEEMEILIQEYFGLRAEITHTTNHSYNKNLKYEKDTTSL